MDDALCKNPNSEILPQKLPNPPIKEPSEIGETNISGIISLCCKQTLNVLNLGSLKKKAQWYQVFKKSHLNFPTTGYLIAKSDK